MTAKSVTGSPGSTTENLTFQPRFDAWLLPADQVYIFRDEAGRRKYLVATDSIRQRLRRHRCAEELIEARFMLFSLMQLRKLGRLLNTGAL
ncbi:hypothetical protein MY11210_007465 [Beauveria gryllotalpidicola]